MRLRPGLFKNLLIDLGVGRVLLPLRSYESKQSESFISYRSGQVGLISPEVRQRRLNYSAQRRKRLPVDIIKLQFVYACFRFIQQIQKSHYLLDHVKERWPSHFDVNGNVERLRPQP